MPQFVSPITLPQFVSPITLPQFISPITLPQFVSPITLPRVSFTGVNNCYKSLSVSHNPCTCCIYCALYFINLAVYSQINKDVVELEMKRMESEILHLREQLKTREKSSSEVSSHVIYMQRRRERERERERKRERERERERGRQRQRRKEIVRRWYFNNVTTLGIF